MAVFFRAPWRRKRSMLSVRNLKFAFQHITIFENFSFDLNAGELLHLKGPNGSGKSTLLSLLAGLRSTFEGDIRFSNVSDLRSCVAYLAAENNGLYQRLSARENIAFWSELNGRANDTHAMEECLEQWGLSKSWIRNMPVGKFSTGMKRRLGLARVQLAKRSCLLLDEPLNGLDRQGVEILKSMLEKHLAAKGSVILVSHETHSIRDLITKELSLV